MICTSFTKLTTNLVLVHWRFHVGVVLWRAVEERRSITDGGDGVHTKQEHLLVSSLVPRSRLFARLLEALAERNR